MFSCMITRLSHNRLSLYIYIYIYIFFFFSFPHAPIAPAATESRKFPVVASYLFLVVHYDCRFYTEVYPISVNTFLLFPPDTPHLQ
jgi:hypothetical protein